MFRLCSNYVSTFSAKVGYVLTVLGLCLDFLDQSWVCFDCARPLSRLSRSKLGMFGLCSTYVSTFSTKVGYVWTVLGLCLDFLDQSWICFDCAPPMSRLSRPTLGMFRLCSTYVSTFSTKVGNVSTVLDLCLDFLDQCWVCFDWARPLSRLSRQKLGMFRLCSTFVSSFSTKVGYVSTVLDLCLDFLDKSWVCFDCARPMSRLSRPKLGMFGLCSVYVSTFSTKVGYVSTVLHLCLDFLAQSWVCFDCARPMSRLSRPKLGMFRLCSTYVSTFSAKVGYVLTVLGLCLDFLDQSWVCFDCARPLSRLSRSKLGMFGLCSTYVSTFSTKVGYVWTVLGLCLDFLDQSWICFDCAPPMSRLSRPTLGMFRLCSTYVSTFSTKVGNVSTVLDLCLDFLDQCWVCFDWARPLSRLSRQKLGMFRLCSTFVSSFSTKVGYVSTVLDLCLDFLDKSWVCFDCARPMSRLSRPKLGMFGLCSVYVSTFSTKVGYVSTVLHLCLDFLAQSWVCFDCARPMSRLSRPKLGMFRLCSTYVSTFSPKVGYVLTVLDLCFDFLDQSWECFDCARPMSRLSRPKLGMFRLCSTYVSTFSPKVGYVSTVLDLCFDFLAQSWACFDCARIMSRLSRPKLGMFGLCSAYVSTFSTKVGYVSTVLHLCLDFLAQSWVCFDCARPMFRLSRPKLGMFRLCSNYVLTFSTKVGYVSTVLDLCLDFLDKSWECFDCARPMSRLSRPKLGMFRLCSTHIWTFSTKVGYVSTVLDPCLDFLDKSWVCFDCARPMSRLSRPKLGMFGLCSAYVSTFSTKVGYVSTVLHLCLDFLAQGWVCFDCARPMFRLSRPKLGMFRLCSTYVSTFSTKVGYVSTVLDLGLDFIDQSWVCFDCARPMSRLSLPKLGVFRLCSTYVSTFSIKVGYVLTVLFLCLDFLDQSWACFDCARIMSRLSRPNLGMFRLCSAFVSTFSTKVGNVSTVLDLCLDFLDQSWVCFDCVRPMSRISRPKLGMFRLCSIYVSTFSTKVGYVSTVLVLCLDFLDQSWACFDCARIMSRLSRPKLGMFRLCSAYVLTFSTKVGYVSTVLDLCLDFLDQSWKCFDCARPMSRLSRPKLGMFRLCSTYVSTFSTKVGYVSTVLDLYLDFLDQSWVCFDCARPMPRLSRQKLGMFRLYSIYVSTFSIKVGYVLTVLFLCLDFLDQSWACFDCARIMSRLSRPKLGMFRLCSTFVSTFSTKVGYVSTVLDLCLDFLDQSWVCFDCAFPMSRLSRPKLGMFRLCSNYVSTFSTKVGYVSTVLGLCLDFLDQNWDVSTVLDLCLDFLDQSWECFDCAPPMSRLSRPKLGMFRLCSTYVSTFSTKVGYVSTVLDLYLDFLDQSWVCFDCAQPMPRLSRQKLGMFRLYSTYVSTFSTKVGYVWTVLGLCLDFLDQSWVCFDCARPMS